MKFRQFEFRLFPKIKNKKKKKPKICNSDFPRDIGLDKNFNYSKSSFHGYYDNLAADDNISDLTASGTIDISRRDVHACTGHCNFACYKTYPLPELKIQIDDLCECTNYFYENDIPQTLIRVAGNALTGTGTPVGTPNTIPRTRTRIKTNPWLPSPRATPSPSPTETVDSIIFSSAGLTTSYQPTLEYFRLEDDCALVDNGPLRRDCLPDYAPLGRENATTFQRLVQIAEHEDDLQNEGVHNECTYNVTDVLSQRASSRKSIEQLKLYLPDNHDIVKDDKRETGKRQKRFSYTEFLKYDTDESICNSPVTETLDFLSHVKYEIDFGYEEDADELLENSGLPRDETFMTIKDLLDDSRTDNLEESHGTSIDDTGFSTNDLEELKMTKSSDYTKKELHESKYSLDDETDELSEDLVNQNSYSNMDLTYYGEGNMQESIDTGYASVSRETDSLSSDDDDDLYLSDVNKSRDMTEHDVSNSRDNELEWDDEPTAQNLLLDFPLDQGSSHSAYESSRLLNNDCECRRKRSRSLADIESSLDEKVTRLREEKLYVQRKIREAIEEENIRREQLAIFQSVPLGNRKEALMKTLCDLKTRLDNQSLRLQTSYDTVLALQRRFSLRRRTTLLVLETDI